MVASVLVAKYGWHLPLYRQAKMLATQGIDLDRSTLAFWVGYAAAELMPLYQRLKQGLLGSAKLAVDETPVPHRRLPLHDARVCRHQPRPAYGAFFPIL
jgi:transposase